MKIIDSASFEPPPTETERLWIYNGLDCAVTFEVLEQLLPQLDNTSTSTYRFSRELQGPVLEMNMRGVLVDQARRAEVRESFMKDILRLEEQFNFMMGEGFGIQHFNWRSPEQCKWLFYEVMGLPPIRKRNAKGELSPTVDRDALERLDDYIYARPIVQHMLGLRDLAKKVSTLDTGVDPDGRMRTNFGIAGTVTGRFSSSVGDFGEGGNLQNWESRLREIFIPDPGHKFGNADLEQADARNVGALVWNLLLEQMGPEYAGAYLDACEGGDLHTTVCKMCWPELPWTGDLSHDKKDVAGRPFYRHLSYRDTTKKLGHGSNYRGTPATMAKNTKIPRSVVESFQSRYFAAYPGIPRWQNDTIMQVLENGYLITPFGDRRDFFGRRNDDETHRAAIAHTPQSMTAKEINKGLLAVWRLNIVDLLLQVHDSILFQYPEDKEDIIVPKVLDTLPVHLALRGGRDFSVPVDCAVGYNWAYPQFDDSGKMVGNERGLKKYKRPARG